MAIAYLCTMGRRTIRIPGNDLSAQMDSLSGKYVHVVTLDGLTHAGKVISSTASGLTIQDVNASWTSRKRHQRSIAVQEIDFVALDTVTSW